MDLMWAFSIPDLLKAKAAAEGARSVHGGVPVVKVGKKWVRIAEGKTLQRQKMDKHRTAREHFDYAMASNLGEIVEEVLQRKGIEDFDALVEAIKTNDESQAHRIYKDVVDAIRSDPAPPGDKQAVLDLFGRSLISLRDQYATKPKPKLMTKVTSSKGKEYYKYEEGKHTKDLPVLKPSVIQSEQKKMGGWTVTGTLSTEHVKKMLKTGAATLVSGKIDPKKPWNLPKKAAGMELKYKGTALTIDATQHHKPKGSKRAKVTARAKIKIPYAYAKAFLLNQVKSTRTKNNLIFRMEHSQGYRDYLSERLA